jgi:DNA-directed RNA polymerase specialized sigma24 family protein
MNQSILFRLAMDEWERGCNADIGVEDLAQDAYVAILEEKPIEGIFQGQDAISIAKRRVRRNAKRSRRRREVSEQVIQRKGQHETPFDLIPEEAGELEDTIKQVRDAAAKRTKLRKVHQALDDMRKRGGAMKLAATIVERKHLAGETVSTMTIAQRLRKPLGEVEKLLAYGMACLAVFVAGRGKLPAWHSREEPEAGLLFERSAEVQPVLPFTMDTVSCVA